MAQLLTTALFPPWLLLVVIFVLGVATFLSWVQWRAWRNRLLRLRNTLATAGIDPDQYDQIVSWPSGRKVR